MLYCSKSSNDFFLCFYIMFMFENMSDLAQIAPLYFAGLNSFTYLCSHRWESQAGHLSQVYPAGSWWECPGNAMVTQENL